MWHIPSGPSGRDANRRDHKRHRAVSMVFRSLPCGGPASSRSSLSKEASRPQTKATKTGQGAAQVAGGQALRFILNDSPDTPSRLNPARLISGVSRCYRHSGSSRTWSDRLQPDLPAASMERGKLALGGLMVKRRRRQSRPARTPATPPPTPPDLTDTEIDAYFDAAAQTIKAVEQQLQSTLRLPASSLLLRIQTRP